MAGKRPDIDAKTKLAVRQRCGFGCVVCGVPIYDYEHIVEYAQLQEHTEDNITLLCPTHHREKTNGLLPVDDVRTVNAEPFNLREGASTPHYLHYSAPEASVNLGGNKMISSDPFVALMVDGNPLVGFKFEDRRCLLNLNLYNDKNEPVLQVVDNELTYSVGFWDVTFVGSTLRIRVGERNVFLEIRFAPPGDVFVTRGRLLYNGVEIDIRPDALLVMNQRTLCIGNVMCGLPVMCDIGDNPNPMSCAVKIAVANRHTFDRKAAMKFLRENTR